MRALDDFQDATRTAPVHVTQPSIGSVWLTQGGRSADDDLLRWPADIFAFTNVILDRAEAYRFTVSPPAGRAWPPGGAPEWREGVSNAARRWSTWAETEEGDPPTLVAREWKVVRDALDTPLSEVASGRAWRICEALLTLHAVADEAAAGIAAGSGTPADGILMRARMSELLARTGSLARIDPTFVRVVPKYHTPYGGITSRSISRYLAPAGPAVDYRVNKVRTPRGNDTQGSLNVLLLPWPLRVTAEDFRPVPDSIRERAVEPFGFFEFQPSEPFDVALVDRLLSSAREHVDRVDAVVLPESSVPRDDVGQLEAVLAANDVTMLIAGVREGRSATPRFGSNWVHFGAAVDGRWWHYRQDKHHRWSLDRRQVQQYHLEGVLDPRVRWWEAVEINRRSLQVIERDDGHTFAALICEDLANLDEVIELLRIVGPSMVVALLLDGPQIASRWTARYASMLADDPGSAVLTLTSYGMVANAWREGRPPSSIVALWKDNARGMQEISLDADAQAILLGIDRRPAIRRAADGRHPEHNTSDLRLAEITQLRAVEGARPRGIVERPGRPSLSPVDNTVLVGWSEALAQAQTTNPAVVDTVLANARAGAPWRADFDLPQPARALANALDALARGDGRLQRHRRVPLPPTVPTNGHPQLPRRSSNTIRTERKTRPRCA
jgi:hypothetical protein